MNLSGKDPFRVKRQSLVKRIYKLKEERSKMSLKIDQLEAILMTKCPHPFEAVREGSYSASYSTTPPMRVCTDCGYAEEGWGCGYWKLDVDWTLHNAIPKLEREEAFKFVRKFWTQDALSAVRFHKK